MGKIKDLNFVNLNRKTRSSGFSFLESAKIVAFTSAVLISFSFESALLSFFLFVFLIFLDKRFILTILLVSPIMETILVATEGITVTKLLAICFALYFIGYFFYKKCFPFDKNVKWIFYFLYIAVIGMVIGFFKLGPNEIIESLQYNFVFVFPKIFIALFIYQYLKLNGVLFLKESLYYGTLNISLALVITATYFIFFSSEEMLWGTNIARLTFKGADPNEFAGMFASLAAFPLFLTVYNKSKMLKLLGFITLGFIVYAISLTISRGGILTIIFLFLIFLVVFLKRSLGKSFIMILLASIGIGLLIYFEIINIYAIQERFTGVNIHDSNDITGGRSRLFSVAINGLVKKPFFGYGNFPGTAWLITSAELGSSHSIHNIFLELGLRLGIIGIIVFMVVVYRAAIIVKLSLGGIIREKNDLIMIIPATSMLVILFAGLGLSWQWREILWYLIGISLVSSYFLKEKVNRSKIKH